MFYSPEIIDELLKVTDLKDVITHTGYNVKGKGNTGHINRCPRCGKNHEHVKANLHKNLFNCFVCGFKGNVIHWIREVEKLGFTDAVERLADISRFELPVLNEETRLRLNRKNTCLSMAVDFYTSQENYYLVDRGISKETISINKIGYAPGGQTLKRYLNDKGFEDTYLFELGLIRKVQNRTLDTFFKRVVIPLYFNGKIVDLYSRAVDDNKVKHFYLYGTFIMMGIDEIEVGYPAILVESPINKLTLESQGYENVIAVGGCNKFSNAHVHYLVKKGVKEAFIGFDTGDDSGAGQEGAIEAGRLLVKNDIATKVIQMPFQTDINDFFLNKNKDQFDILLQEAKLYMEYKSFLMLDQIPENLIRKYLGEKV